MDRDRLGEAVTELTDEQVMQPEMSDAEVMAPAGGGGTDFDKRFQGMSAEEDQASQIGEMSGFDAIPTAFSDRLYKGSAMERILKHSAVKGAEGFGDKTPMQAATGLSDETVDFLVEHGVFHDPKGTRTGPLQLANEAMIIPVAKLVDNIMRSINAGVYTGAGALGQIVEELGGEQGTAARAERETINMANWMARRGYSA